MAKKILKEQQNCVEFLNFSEEDQINVCDAFFSDFENEILTGIVDNGECCTLIGLDDDPPPSCLE